MSESSDDKDENPVERGIYGTVRQRPGMNVKFLRRIQRINHLIAAGLLGFAVYSGLITSDAWLGIIRFVVFPVLGISGLALWFAPRIIRATQRTAR